MGFGNLLGGYGHSTLWNSYLPPVFSRGPDRGLGGRHPGAHRLEMALRGHPSAPARVDARNRFPALSMGRLQRIDDDVSSRPGIFVTSATGRNLERLEANYIRVWRLALHRRIRATVCASVFTGMV